jgi:formate-dependent nitrite reductase cytochrome c552 subunit
MSSASTRSSATRHHPHSKIDAFPRYIDPRPLPAVTLRVGGKVASHSNVPTVQTCMSCHQQGKAQSPKLQAVRAAWNGGKGDGPTVDWVKIHSVPDYAYFNHAVHVNRGVSCFSCHGAVNEMKVVYQHEPQSMAWCLECHRAPENHLRPPDQIFNMNWKAASSDEQRRLGMRFKEEWDVNPPVTCGGCHR